MISGEGIPRKDVQLSESTFTIQGTERNSSNETMFQEGLNWLDREVPRSWSENLDIYLRSKTIH